MHVGGEQLRREDDCVVERGAPDLVDLEPASWKACLPTATTAIRSLAGFERTKERAAAVASCIARPSIDCDRSKSSTTLFSRPKFFAEYPITGWPSSLSLGAFSAG